MKHSNSKAHVKFTGSVHREHLTTGDHACRVEPSTRFSISDHVSFFPIIFLKFVPMGWGTQGGDNSLVRALLQSLDLDCHSGRTI